MEEGEDDIILVTKKEDIFLDDEDYEDFNDGIEEDVEMDEQLLKMSGEYYGE